MPKDKKEIPVIEDIFSDSSPKNDNPIQSYANNLYTNLGNVIKVIAFAVAFLFIIIGFVAAFLIFAKTVFSVVLGCVAIIVCTCIAACVFFLIFGIGHILCQNNEILKQLNKK